MVHLSDFHVVTEPPRGGSAVMNAAFFRDVELE